MNERTRHLIDEYLRLYHSRRNAGLRALWREKPSGFAVNLHRPDEARSFSETGVIPLVVNPCETIFAHLYRYSLKDYYTQPSVYLEMYLRQRIEQFSTIGDDSCLRAEIPIWLGSYFEHSFFGLASIYSDEETPRPDYRVLIKSRSDLDAYREIDFRTTGHGPLAVRFFEEISRMVDGTGLRVTMPYFNRGPFGVLSILMGYDGLFFGAHDDPEFVKEAVDLVVKVTLDYERWINRTFASPLGAKAIYNDDVSCPILSPAFYRDFILPAEKDMERNYGAFSYWHSCGNCDDLLPLIKELKIESLNLSMVGDVDKYTTTFGNSTAYEICVHPIRDVLNASPIEMSRKLDQIISTCARNGIKAFSILASALEGTGQENLLSDFRHIQAWLEMARGKTEGFLRARNLS